MWTLLSTDQLYQKYHRILWFNFGFIYFECFVPMLILDLYYHHPECIVIIKLIWNNSTIAFVLKVLHFLSSRINRIKRFLSSNVRELIHDFLKLQTINVHVNYLTQIILVYILVEDLMYLPSNFFQNKIG